MSSGSETVMNGSKATTDTEGNVKPDSGGSNLVSSVINTLSSRPKAEEGKATGTSGDTKTATGTEEEGEVEEYEDEVEGDYSHYTNAASSSVMMLSSSLLLSLGSLSLIGVVCEFAVGH